MSLKLVDNKEEYFEFIRIIRNSPDLQGGFIDKTYITTDMQAKYMEKHAKDYYVCLMDDEPVGFIGVVDNDVRVAVDKKFHNKGIGSFMIKKMLEIRPYFDVKVICSNNHSLRMFEKVGFFIVRKDTVSGVDVFILQNADEE